MPSRQRSAPRREPRDWLNKYIGVQSQYDRELADLLEEAAREASERIADLDARSGVGAEVRASQVREARGAIAGTVSALWQRIGRLVLAGERSAQLAALEQSFDWDDVLLRRVYPDEADRAALKAALMATAERNVEAMIARVLVSRVPLSDRVYRTSALSSGWVDRRVSTAIARGATVAELAAEVRDAILPTTPGGVSYAARRLARTEINNAYHATSILNNQDKPWVKNMDWNLSRSHPDKDKCDELAQAGPYPRGEVPVKPHPQCLCYVTPAAVSIDQFVKEFNAGKYDGWLGANMQTSSALAS